MALTAKKDCYGYELVEAISNKIEIAEGTIYPLLRRLTVDGVFSTYLKESTEGPPRKYYKLTERGREMLADLTDEWMRFTDGVYAVIEEGRK